MNENPYEARKHGTAEIIGDVAEFARQRPALFLGGAFVLGLLGSRLFKAKAPPKASSRKRFPEPLHIPDLMEQQKLPGMVEQSGLCE